MPDKIASTAPAAPAQRTPGDVANNLVNNITRRAGGKAPEAAAAAPPVNGQQPPADPSAVNAGKEKYVVEGQEVWLTSEQARSYVQKGIAFEPRMDQLARLQQESAQLQRALVTDPGKVLANLAKSNNIPLEKVVQNILRSTTSDSIKEAVGQWYYEDVIEPLKMTEPERKARENEKWRKEREEQDKTTASEAIRRENYEKFQANLRTIKINISEAMKESGLPDNNTPLGVEMARLVADTMRVAHFKREGMTPKQAIEIVKKRIKSVNSAYYETLEGDALAAALGDTVLDRVKKHLLKLAKGGGGPIPAVPNGGKPAARGRERKTMGLDEFHDYLDGLKKQG